MSLEVDGIWNAGVWATTVWADDVWREGEAAQESGADPWGNSWGDSWGESWGGATAGQPDPPGQGHKVRQFRYVVEVDNHFIGVNSIEEARQVLAHAEVLAVDAAAASPAATPRIRIKSKGPVPRSLRRQVANTQRAVTKTFETAYENSRELSQTLQRKRLEEDEDDAIHALLM